MKKGMIAVVLWLLPTMLWAASASIELQKANNDIFNKVSLQNGAKLYVNYCMGCHSLQYMRYQRLAEDLNLTKEQVEDNLIFDPNKKFGDLMTIAMDPEEAETWFGVAPPDLSLTARSRGTDWLYTYLLSFYQDPAKPLGANNLVFKDVGMPHVLWEMQGIQTLKHETDEEGHETTKLSYVEEEDAEKAEAFRQDMTDLVNFLEYVGEPAKLQRLQLGWKVILFLFFFLIVAYIMKREFWRDIH